MKEITNNKVSLPKPGDIVVYDYRPLKQRKKSTRNTQQSEVATLKCIQWNIERGYKLDHVIDILKSHHADIICLQELDISCERSFGRNNAIEIAEALGMKCAFLCEFEELHSPLRNKVTQGGGLHGNAILSKYDLYPFVIPHTHHPVDWESEGASRREPRRGERAILAADIHVPGVSSPVLCLSLHLEVFCGIFGRIKQFADAVGYSKSQSLNRPYQLIFGDLNTMAHGIARLSPVFCRDGLRYWSIGYSEAAWWDHHILRNNGRDWKDSPLKSFIPRHLSLLDVEKLSNPLLFDPFSVNKDTTLQGYKGMFQGKLDWTLLRGFHVLGKGMDNHDYSASDHKLLHVIVRPVIASDQDDPGLEAYLDHQPAYRHSRILEIAWKGMAISIFGIVTAYALGKLSR